MTRTPVSVRFHDDVAIRLGEFAARRQSSVSAAVGMLLDEALRREQHPLIVFRDGPTGRRAGISGGPDVWEIVYPLAAIRAELPGADAQQVRELLYESSGATPAQVDAAWQAPHW